MFPTEFDPRIPRGANRPPKPLGALVERALQYAEQIGVERGKADVYRQQSVELAQKVQKLEADLSLSEYRSNQKQEKIEELILDNHKLDDKIKALTVKAIPKGRKKV